MQCYNYSVYLCESNEAKSWLLQFKTRFEVFRIWPTNVSGFFFGEF